MRGGGMKRIVLCCLFLLACFHTRCMAQEFENKKEISLFLEGISPELVKGNIKPAFEKIQKYWPIPAQELDAVVYQLESQRSQILNRYGKPLAMERAKKLALGDSFYKEIYLLKYEKHAMCWIFTFYRPEEKWIVNSIIATDQIDSLFEEK